jgi:hypothetical protein
LQAGGGSWTGHAFPMQITGRLHHEVGFRPGLNGNPNLRGPTLLAKQNARFDRGAAAMASRVQFNFKLQQGRRWRQTGNLSSAISRQRTPRTRDPEQSAVESLPFAEQSGGLMRKREDEEVAGGGDSDILRAA